MTPNIIRPLREAILTVIILLAMSVSATYRIYLHAVTLVTTETKEQLLRIAEGAASLVDGDAHDSFQSPDQESTEAYQRAIAPLRKLLFSVKDIKYIYTTRMVDGKVYFVLDSVPYGDSDHDGVEDHSSIMDPYDDADEELIRSLKESTPMVTKKPYTDQWGTFVSAYMPIWDSKGRQVGVLCVDMEAVNYQKHVYETGMFMLSSLMFPAILSLLAGLIVYFYRRRLLYLVEVHRQDQKKLRQEAERYEILSRATKDAVWDWDINRDIVVWNEAIHTLFGYEQQKVNPSSDWWKNKIHPDDQANIWKSVMEAISLNSESLWKNEYRFERADGTYAHVYDHGYVMRDDSGKAFRMIGSMTDMTELKNLESQLIQAQKLESIGNLAGGIAHDFNNLLTVINGYADLTVESLAPDNPLRADLEEIFKAGKRAQSLTNQLLAFSHRQVVKPVLVDLGSLVANLDKMLKRLLGENIEIVMLVDDSLKMVKIDPGQMEQVIINLAVNARDAMSGKGKIIFQTTNCALNEADFQNDPGLKPGTYVQLSVTDTGIGMSAEIKRHLFEPFFTTKPKGKGTGLGLATCYGIIKQMDGFITVQSELGKGSTFKLFLPVAAESGIGEKEKGEERQAFTKRSETILLVEDEAMVRQFCARVLRNQGYTLYIAQNGVEAINLFEELAHKHIKVDLLLTDVVMPQMGGKEVVDRIKKAQPNLKVLFMSGYTGDALDMSGVLDSNIELIPKPFSPFSLIAKVHEVLSNRKRGS